jgi:hypothetical protein
MEPASAKTLLNFLKSYGVKIDFFATDRSSSVKYGFLVIVLSRAELSSEFGPKLGPFTSKWSLFNIYWQSVVLDLVDMHENMIDPDHQSWRGAGCRLGQ